MACRKCGDESEKALCVSCLKQFRIELDDRDWINGNWIRRERTLVGQEGRFWESHSESLDAPDES